MINFHQLDRGSDAQLQVGENLFFDYSDLRVNILYNRYLLSEKPSTYIFHKTLTENIINYKLHTQFVLILNP